MKQHSRPSASELLAAQRFNAPDARDHTRRAFVGNVHGYWGTGELDDDARVRSFEPFKGDA